MTPPRLGPWGAYGAASALYLGLAVPLCFRPVAGPSAQAWVEGNGWGGLALLLGPQVQWSYGLNLLGTLAIGGLLVHLLLAHRQGVASEPGLVFLLVAFFYLSPLNLPGFLVFDRFERLGLFLLLLLYRLHLFAQRQGGLWRWWLLSPLWLLCLYLDWQTTCLFALSLGLAQVIALDLPSLWGPGVSLGAAAGGLKVYLWFTDQTLDKLRPGPTGWSWWDGPLSLLVWGGLIGFVLWPMVLFWGLRRSPQARRSRAFWVPMTFLWLLTLTSPWTLGHLPEPPVRLLGLSAFGTLLLGLYLSGRPVKLGLPDFFLFLGALVILFLTLRDPLLAFETALRKRDPQALAWALGPSLATLGSLWFGLWLYWRKVQRPEAALFLGLYLNLIAALALSPWLYLANYSLGGFYGLKANQLLVNYAKRHLAGQSLGFPGSGALVPDLWEGGCQSPPQTDYLILADPILTAGGYCFSLNEVETAYLQVEPLGPYRVWRRKDLPQEP
ncbi:MAG: hypothetical protein A2600_01530 [Candidatus Lambdaproteobacteria bacterium RIFOXYD1_FULL_56_27]|nr:MAG: hypothetical protein A2600_01530 [Candidatus Lambdaproteobacteria bacterium RIFOXYD1_FULL_56_27]